MSDSKSTRLWGGHSSFPLCLLNACLTYQDAGLHLVLEVPRLLQVFLTAFPTDLESCFFLDGMSTPVCLRVLLIFSRQRQGKENWGPASTKSLSVESFGFGCRAWTFQQTLYSHPARTIFLSIRIIPNHLLHLSSQEPLFPARKLNGLYCIHY